MRFGISTHLFHDRRLEREHLVQVAAYGFDALELFATRSHFDYHDDGTVLRLAQWLSETGLSLHSVHAPIMDRFGSGQPSTSFSHSASDNARRQAAVRETEAALAIARRIPFRVLVVHLGTPGARAAVGDNSRAAALKSVEEICRLAEPLRVRVAFEVIPNDLSRPASL